MEKWEELFPQNTRKKGRELLENGRIRDLSVNENEYSAAVLGRERYEVKISMDHGIPVRTECSCAVGRGRGKCAHMAAVLYAAEQEKAEEEKKSRAEQEKAAAYSHLDGAETDRGSAEDEKKAIRMLQGYRYFHGDQIRKSLKLSTEAETGGRKAISGGRLRLEQVGKGFERSGGQVLGQASAIGETERGRKSYFPVRLVFSSDEALRAECGCPECARSYRQYSGDCRCKYTAGLALLLEEYLKDHNIGDMTDAAGQYIIESTLWGKLMKQTKGPADPMRLEPRLIQKDKKLYVSFKTGAGRMFVVKNLEEFCEHVKNGEEAVYGSSTVLSHKRENFTEGSLPWLEFVNRIVQEEVRFADRMEDSWRFSGNRPSVGMLLELFGWRLDQFYELMGPSGVEAEDRDHGKKKQVLYARTGSPRIQVEIEPRYAGGKPGPAEKFDGVQVSGTMPELFYGMDTAYFIEADGLYRQSGELSDGLERLADVSMDGSFRFFVGRNRLAEFYHMILPRFREIAQVAEKDGELIRSFLPPRGEYQFYLDAEGGDFVCRPVVRYGNQEYSPVEAVRCIENGQDLMEPFRSLAEEAGIALEVKRRFPVEVPQKEEFSCGGDEEVMYQVAENGVAALASLGEVLCTDRFRGCHVVRRVQTAVGVSVSSGMLDLKIDTGDIPPEELVDLLHSYRQKKKYHRLKNGTFVRMEESSVGMLEEMAAALRLTPKEMIRGNMHLPVYRALYLDRLLEEHEDVYSKRDSHFKQIVKSFKTIKDADFEEPESLSATMRQYQKNGYRWLRTLESWNFGGILADDMGLGKTLQMIAVLLAAKLEGKTGTSLIVTPASLVFNWGEEFKKFAPELKVTLAAGTQAERQKRLEESVHSDVLITSYDLLKRDAALYEGREFLYQVLDEAQYIKNHTTAAAKAVKVIKSRFRFALTGTPIENRLSELWSIFDYLMPGFLYGYDTFRREFEIPVVKNNDQEAMERLQRMVGPFILRRLKQDVLRDLPEKTEEVRYVQMTGKQRKLYDGQAIHLRSLLDHQSEEEFNNSRFQVLTELTRLRQICCDPALCFEDYGDETAKTDACMELVQSAVDGGHRLLVFSQFTSMLDILSSRLDGEHVEHFMITGATPKEKRLQLVNAFNGGAVPVFLISLKAGGVGLNLTGADMVVHYDPWWNLAAQNQATDRAHRIGQQKNVTVYKLITKDSIEEKVLELQETKRELADRIIGQGTEQAAPMTREDMLRLLEIQT
ncbi:SNF2 helicase associated domain-containing protein [Lachnospiraceae bacterium BX10]|uniref:SNF2 helicase associated domain-containing protein n=1 Tax=Enterocloster hominis (ex Liu et al. 2021) TaxID=2763663 RepID=A0ABR7NSB0_9FIRM|nr:DEAD/DEAH box helicase [Enterocloster hominis]MBC8599016.1 SNF2 helicase associated domain-containing protein [Enterocloster hominis]